MKIYNRTIKKSEEGECIIQYFGYNSNGVFTICMSNGNIMNIKDKELYKLKQFLDKINI